MRKNEEVINYRMLCSMPSDVNWTELEKKTELETFKKIRQFQLNLNLTGTGHD
jgi:hypothetical protein